MPDDELTPDAFTLPARIDLIEIRGLSRTQEFVVLRELGYRPGDVVDLAMWNLAVTRLWNTLIFARVRSHLEEREGKHVAVYVLEERWTISPIFRFAASGDTGWLRLGLAEMNFLGRFLEVGAFYERFGTESGGQVYARDPRFLGKRIDLLLAADRLVRPRPGFAVQRTRGAAELNVLAMQDRLRYGLRFEGFQDTFLPPTEGGPRRFMPDMRALALDLGFRVGRVDSVRVRYRGASLEARPGVLHTDGLHAWVGQLVLEGLFFALLGDHFNLAIRARAGTQTPSQEQLQFYLGGLDYVRGIPDNHLLGRAFAMSNVEMRFLAFDSKWVALMMAGFVDGAVVRRDDGFRDGVITTGGGVRILFPWLVASGLRVDVATPLTGDLPPLLSVGIHEFF